MHVLLLRCNGVFFPLAFEKIFPKRKNALAARPSPGHVSVPILLESSHSPFYAQKVTAQEYNQCVKIYADSLYRFACKVTGRAADAEDAVQSAFEALWRQHEQIDFGKAKAWLFSTAHHKAVDQYRKGWRTEFPETLPDQRPQIPESNRFELREHIDRGLASLSEVQRSVLLLRDYEGYDYTEIGRLTDLSESQVKVYIFRARQKMQSYLSANAVSR